VLLGLGLLAAAVAGAATWWAIPARNAAVCLLQLNARGPRAEGENATAAQKTQGALLKSSEVLNKALDSPALTDVRQGRSRDELLTWLQTDLTPDFTLGPELMRVTLLGEKPDQLALVLNEIADSFNRVVTDREAARALARINQLEKARKDANAELAQKRGQLDNLLTGPGQQDAEAVRSRRDLLMAQIAALNNARLTNAAALQRAELALGDKRRQMVGTWHRQPRELPISQLEIEAELARDQSIQKFELQCAEVRDRITLLRRNESTPVGRQQLGDAERELKIKEQALREVRDARVPGITLRLRAQAAENLRAEVGRLDTELKVTRRFDEDLGKQLQTAQDEIQVINRKMAGAGIEEKRDQIELQQQIVRKLGEEIGALRADYPPTARVTVIEPAQGAGPAKGNRRVKFTAAAAFAPWLPVFRWQLSQGAARSAETWWQHLALLPLFAVAGRTLVWKGAGVGVVAAVDLAIIAAVFAPLAWALLSSSPRPLWGRGAGGEGVNDAAGACTGPLTPDPSPPKRGRGEQEGGLGLLLAWVIGLPAVAGLVSLLLTPMVHVHYLSVVLPALLLLGAAGLTAAWRSGPRAGAVVATAALVLLTAASLLRLATATHKDDWRGLAAAVAEDGGALPAYFYEDIGTDPFGYYRPDQPRRPITQRFGDGSGWSCEPWYRYRPSVEADMRREAAGFWVVLYPTAASRDEVPRVVEWLGRRFVVEREVERGGLQALRCRPRAEGRP
jgi:hypothetical protein